MSEEMKNAIAGLSETALRPLINERDTDVRDKAISHVENAT